MCDPYVQEMLGWPLNGLPGELVGVCGFESGGVVKKKSRVRLVRWTVSGALKMGVKERRPQKGGEPQSRGPSHGLCMALEARRG
jgi:hypothetical protein